MSVALPVSVVSAPRVPFKPVWVRVDGSGDVSLMTSVHLCTSHSFQSDFCFALLNVQCEEKTTELSGAERGAIKELFVTLGLTLD